jgi:hypothetical protein
VLRDELNVVMYAFRSDEYAYLIGVKPRGKILMESNDLIANKLDGQLIGTAFSIPVYRGATDIGADNGVCGYFDQDDNLIFFGIW